MTIKDAQVKDGELRQQPGLREDLLKQAEALRLSSRHIKPRLEQSLFDARLGCLLSTIKNLQECGRNHNDE